MVIKNKQGTEMLLADPMSRLSPPPSEDTLDLHQKVCLVQFCDTKLDNLKKDTSPDPELLLCEKSSMLVGPESGNNLQCI